MSKACKNSTVAEYIDSLFEPLPADAAENLTAGDSGYKSTNNITVDGLTDSSFENNITADNPAVGDEDAESEQILAEHQQPSYVRRTVEEMRSKYSEEALIEWLPSQLPWLEGVLKGQISNDMHEVCALFINIYIKNIYSSAVNHTPRELIL